ncbi:hypothetical protein ABZ858_05780 [Streptomyces sp. NPDC047017]|uniref:hypothetical protein n=1 Tax=Streptomyces sp. NPDC047017 TaxID=3155024 RepID=UPI0033FFEA89
MTTRSSPPQPHRSAVAVPEEAHRAGPGECPVADVVRLVTLLPVEDVARLVAELTRPPRPADGADAAIRAAVEHRGVEDVTRLLALLHRAPQRPHCGREAVRAAVGARTADELVDVVGGLARAGGRSYDAGNEPAAPREESPLGATAADDSSALTGAPDGQNVYDGQDVHDGQDGEDTAPDAEGRGMRGARAGRPVFWPGWVAAAALVVCGVAHFPLRREGAPFLVYGVALAVSALCGALAVTLAVRAGVAVLVAGSVVPAVLAALGYLEGRFAPAELTRVLAITVAPPSSAGLTAVCAALASLAALSLLLMVHVAERHPAPLPTD